MKRKRGFTLVEIIVVITILGVLATLAVVGYASFSQGVHAAEVMKYYSDAKTAAMTCYNTKGNWESCDTLGKYEFVISSLPGPISSTAGPYFGCISHCTTANGYCDFTVAEDVQQWWALMRIYSDGTVKFNGSGPFLNLAKNAGAFDNTISPDSTCIP